MNDSLSKRSRDVSTYKAGRVIYTEGDPSDFLYIVKSGEVRLFTEIKNRLVNTGTVGKNDFLEELSLFSEDPVSSSAVAYTDSEIVKIKKTDLNQFFEQCPEWISAIMQTLCNRLKHSIDMLKEHGIADDAFTDRPLPASEIDKLNKKIAEFKKEFKVN